ncbi:hypothetical protein BJS_04532 [Bradyrhizobium japonicum SEMIA 5079]|nr:hypothetical protein BJS_04532 [Bradyrhizobium japonicum SEMIA 5079]
MEGPSGVGKTSSLTKILQELDLDKKAVTLSGRKPSDRDFIEQLHTMGDLGIVIIDDFHRLPNDLKQRIADFMKVLADEGREESKLVLLGINKAGDHLVTFGHDLGLRIDVFRLEAKAATQKLH